MENWIDAVSYYMTPKEHKGELIIAIWIIFLICLTIVAGHAISAKINDYKAAPVANIDSKIVPMKSEDNPYHTDVVFGTFINRISGLSMRDSKFDVDFYIWFSWNGSEVNPGEDLQIINGQISSKQLQADWHEGEKHYEQYQVLASITEPFEVVLFPFDSHNLTIEIEDSYNGIYELEYVPENNQNSSISPKIYIPGYSVKFLSPVAELHRYSTNFSSPWEDTIPSIYSKIIFGVGIIREGYGYYFKLFQSLFVAVAVAILGFFLKPDYAPRFVVGVGALFAAVANYYNILSMQPIVGYMTLADIINLIGILTIFLSLIQSSISVYMYDNLGKKELSRRFDKYSAIVFILCYVSINWWIVLIATHR
jgi:hypothetical protein